MKKKLFFLFVFLSIQILDAQVQIPIDVDSLKIFNRNELDQLSKGKLGINSYLLEQVRINKSVKENNDILKLPGCVDNIKVPTKKEELTDGWKEYFYKMNYNAAVNLGLINMVQGESSSNLEVYVYDFMLLKDVQDCKGNDYRFGSGMRLIVKYRKLDSDVKVTGLPSVAASVQLNKAEVTVEMRTYGISGDKVNLIAPMTGDYDVRKHVEYMETIDNFKKQVINDRTTNYTPKLISYSPSTIDFNVGIAQYYALKYISKRKTYNDAISKIKDTRYHLEIEKVYKFQMRDNWQLKPSRIDQLTAKKYLKSIFDE